MVFWLGMKAAQDLLGVRATMSHWCINTLKTKYKTKPMNCIQINVTCHILSVKPLIPRAFVKIEHQNEQLPESRSNLPACHLNASWGSRQDQSPGRDDECDKFLFSCDFKASCAVPGISFDINKQTKRALASSTCYTWFTRTNMLLKAESLLLFIACSNTSQVIGRCLSQHRATGMGTDFNTRPSCSLMFNSVGLPCCNFSILTVLGGFAHECPPIVRNFFPQSTRFNSKCFSDFFLLTPPLQHELVRGTSS